MIEFKDTDFNLTKIKRESKLFNLVTGYKYWVYGLRQTGNQPVMIEYHYDKVDEHFTDKLEALIEFFKLNGIEIETYAEADNNGRVDIGLRKDLRAIVNRNGKPMLASSILSTIIYALEGRIEIEELKNYKLSTTVKLEKVVGHQESEQNT